MPMRHEVCVLICGSRIERDLERGIVEMEASIASGHGFNRAAPAGIHHPLPLTRRERGDHKVVGEGISGAVQTVS
ncbi:MAG TPA: hypothetical protein VFD30_07140 [Terriglobia bacterium]|nr:hypothetical protein [Terriglobia bacterium]